MANKLNMTIAKTNQLSTRVVGMQLTGGNFIGLVLSAIQMVLGFTFLIANADVWTKVAVSVIGVALAVLIERLTLGGLIAIRVSNERIHQLEETHFEMLQVEKRDETERERVNLNRRMKKLKSDRKMSIPVAAVGMVLSTSIGDIFWHRLFESLGPVMSFVLGVACAAVIGLTFVYSEIYKAIMDGTLSEIISDQILMTHAVKAEEQNIQLDMVIDGYDAIRKDGGKLEPAQTKVEETLVDRLSAFADAVAQNGFLPNGTKAEQIGSGEELKQLPAAPAERINGRGRYRECREELARMRQQTNPRPSMQDIATHFGIAKSTVFEWIDRLETEQAGTTGEQTGEPVERSANDADRPTAIADKLDKTVAAMKENPDITDEELAVLLDLKRPASARFWRLKAEEVIASKVAV